MRLGIFGGMFDPVHYGHLRPALEVFEQARLDELRFIPCARPPHRESPRVEARDRADLLEAAIAGRPEFRLDTRELDRAGLSYTVDTLASLQEELPGATLVLLIGEDAFRGFASWHRWERILEQAHLAIMRRPGTPSDFDPLLENLLRERETAPGDLADGQAGQIAWVEVTPLGISSTAIRRLIVAGCDPGYLLPEAVAEKIREKALYESLG